MPLQNFIDNNLPTIKAAWLNSIDAFYTTLFQSATTAAAARLALDAAKSDVVTAAIGSSVQAFNANTIAVAPGAAGNKLQSNGSAWASVLDSQIQPLTAAVGANSITITPGALSLDFRSTTLTTGTVTRVSGTPAALVIAATDSFGLVTAAGNQRLVILAINNAGTIELACSALAGGVALDETGVITTATAATLGTHIKAANVRTGVAYRVIGFVDATFTTAVGWGSLAEVQGCGGQALAAMSSIGYGQTWQNLTASRTATTTYYNTTGKPIFVVACLTDSLGQNIVNATVNGLNFIFGAVSVAAGFGAAVSFVVPPGASYSVTIANFSSVASWRELR